MKRMILSILISTLIFLCIQTSNAQSILLAQGSQGLSYGDSWHTNMTTTLDTASNNNVTVTQNFGDLSQMLLYDAIWLDVRGGTGFPGSDYSGPLSNTELDNILSFSNTGKRVVLLGEWGSWDYGPELGWQTWDNKILSIVGGSYEGAYGDSPLAINPQTILQHELTEGVTSLQITGNRYGAATGGTALFDPNIATLWGENNNILTILDTGVFSDSFWNAGDNSQFAQNVARWIANSGTFPYDYIGSVTCNNDFIYSMTLGDTFSFDFWWEMGQEPDGFNMDIFFFRDNSWHLLGGDLNFDGSSSAWESISVVVPEALRGLETQIRFSVYDLGDYTDPTVYLRNIASNGTAPVPEPATMLLLGTGLIGLTGMRRRLKKSKL